MVRKPLISVVPMQERAQVAKVLGRREESLNFLANQKSASLVLPKELLPELAGNQTIAGVRIHDFDPNYRLVGRDPAEIAAAVISVVSNRRAMAAAQ